MQECQHKQPLCDCIDWKKHDLDVELKHIRENFEFTGYELEYNFPSLYFRLALLGMEDGDFQRHSYHEGYYQGSYSPHGAYGFAALREEMGFAA